ncbi:MAG: hypothetical protein V7785_23230 [Bermanella sp.]
MTRFYLSHPVKDFDAWKPVFDADESRRSSAGLSTVGVFRQFDNGNNVLVVFEGNDTQAMRDMLADPSLADAMKSAGVMAPPQTFAGEEL